MLKRRRLDAELVRRGMAETRNQAQQLIEEGAITVNGAVAEKASRQVQAGDALELLASPEFVSRAGLKLKNALNDFAISPKGLACMDVGSSTGGFTDCLLQQGAAKVVAVDVGTNQLHEKIRTDNRVVSLEKTDIRKVRPTEIIQALGGKSQLTTADVSFISLKKVIPAILNLTEAGADMALLCKPQFEAARSETKKGIVRDEAVHKRVVDEICLTLLESGAEVLKTTESAPAGVAGNKEFFIHARKTDSRKTSKIS